ncbi:MAG: efflux RND transporter periplasmic adaptor subunit [Gallionella sp.]|nr:efflux RND transporter periplasmic adaptor subunit [Gallionella sp.]
MKEGTMKVHIQKARPVLLLLAGTLLLGGAGWLASRHSVAAPVASVNRPALSVKTVALRPEQWVQTLSANGSIIPWQEAVIGSQLQGVRIADVKVSIGDRVQRGKVLATLDNTLRPAGSTAPQGRIVAPDDGVISAVNANVGTMPKSDAELFRLIRQGRLEWQAELTAEELMRLRRGMRVSVTLGDGRTVQGTVRAISPKVEMQTRFGHALVRLEDSSNIVAGVFARGTFDLTNGKRKLASLPQTAVMQRGSQSYVLVVEAESRVHERTVRIGQRVGDRIEIKQGLAANERVVETGGPFLTEGDVVQVVAR